MIYEVFMNDVWFRRFVLRFNYVRKYESMSSVRGLMTYFCVLALSQGAIYVYTRKDMRSAFSRVLCLHLSFSTCTSPSHQCPLYLKSWFSVSVFSFCWLLSCVLLTFSAALFCSVCSVPFVLVLYSVFAPLSQLFFCLLPS